MLVINKQPCSNIGHMGIHIFLEINANIYLSNHSDQEIIKLISQFLKETSLRLMNDEN